MNIHLEIVHAAHLTCITKQNEYLALVSKGNEIGETKIRISYIAALTEGSDDLFDTKTLNLAVSSFSPCVFNLVANSSERVYFEQQILTLLLFYPTPNLSRIKCAYILQQVKGSCIS